MCTFRDTHAHEPRERERERENEREREREEGGARERGVREENEGARW